MKKKGFTLVELLATIVVLSVIALIATPLILNVIEKAKIGALENSANGLVESANMYYANNTIKGERIIETTFDFEDGVQVSDKKLEYKGKVYNGKLILHASGEVAVCIDDKEHYAYKNKDTDQIVSGIGICKYDGTTGDFSSNSGITDLRGKTIAATEIEESGDNAIITIPEEGHYDTTSKISVSFDQITNKAEGLEVLASTISSGFNNSSTITTTKDYSYIIVMGAGGNNNSQVTVNISNSAGTKTVLIDKMFSTDGYMQFSAAYIEDVPAGTEVTITTSYNGARLILGIV